VDEQKKQKVLIGLLAVLIIGMGTYFVAFRGTGASTRQGVATGTVERKTRESAPKPTEKKRPARAEASKDEEERTADRKVREASEDRGDSGRKARRTDVKEGKKKKVSAAS